MAELGVHQDARGIIRDLLAGPLDMVTEIRTTEGAVRGNHVHQRTAQWAYVVSGSLLVAWTEDDGVHTRVVGPGDLVHEPPGIPHAWKAASDCVVLVFTRGPRSGQDYESDVTRLPENARLLT